MFLDQPEPGKWCDYKPRAFMIRKRAFWKGPTRSSAYIMCRWILSRHFPRHRSKERFRRWNPMRANRDARKEKQGAMDFRCPPDLKRQSLNDCPEVGRYRRRAG